MRKRLNVRPCRFTAVTGLRATVMTAAAALGLSAAAVAPAEAATVKVTSHFVWVATSANSAGDSTFINNGATNGRPGDLLFITPNLTPGGINPCFPAVCLLTPLSAALRTGMPGRKLCKPDSRSVVFSAPRHLFFSGCGSKLQSPPARLSCLGPAFRKAFRSLTAASRDPLSSRAPHRHARSKTLQT